MGVGSGLTRRGGAAALVLAAALTGCSGALPPPRPVPVPPPPPAPTSSTVPAPADPAQELAQLRAAVEAAPRPFSAVLATEAADGTGTVRRQGVVNVSDVQTGALSLTSTDQQPQQQAYLTVTRDAAYTRAADRAWVRSARPSGPLLPDHRAMVRALLERDPASFRGRARIRTLRGGTGFHLVGRLPLAEVADAFDTPTREQLAQHRVPDCAADLLIDADGRLSELTLTCESDGYRLRSTVHLAEFGPPAETPPPADL